MKVLEDKEHGNIESSLNYFLRFNLPKNVKILDIGCNYGSLIYNLYKKNYKNVCGLDINKASIKEGEKAYPLIKNKIKFYDGKSIPFKNETFDVVLMFDVIEHIPDIKSFMKKQVVRVLKRQGFFIYQTPNKFTNVPWEILHQKSFKKWRTYHCSLQTYNNLKRLLNENFANFKIEKYNIKTEHNLNKLSKRIGKIPAKSTLWILDKFPLSITTNFWGWGRK